MDTSSQKKQSLWVYLFLALSVLLVYGQTRNFEFLQYDDPANIVDNPHVANGLTRSGIAWAFSSAAVDYWKPLVWLSHMLDCTLYGLNAGGHHLTNVILHLANALLLFAVLKRMTHRIWQSAFVSCLFALHPLHIQSVAWVTERKDVLSAFFWFVTMWTYAAYTESPSVKRMAWVAVWFAMGLLSKPMVLTLPFVLLLLDVWPLKRLSLEQPLVVFFCSVLRLLREKIPLFILSALSCALTLATTYRSRQLASLETFPLSGRVANALVSYVKYLGKTIWPSKLSIYYFRPEWPVTTVLIAASVIVLITVSIILLRHRKPYLMVGWFWFLGVLVPVIGLIQGNWGEAMADRFTYLPLIGLYMIIAWGTTDLLARWRHHQTALAALSLMSLSVLLIYTTLQVRYWKTDRMIFEHAARVTSNNALAEMHVGIALSEAKQYEQALERFREALRISPNYALAHYNAAVAFTGLGKQAEAIAHYIEALRFAPDYEKAHYNLGLIRESEGDLGEAISHYAAAVRARPDFVEARNNLGQALLKQGAIEEAVGQFSEAIRIDPSYGKAHYNFAVLLASQGKLNEAIEHYSAAIRVRPDYVEAYNNLGLVLALRGHPEAAIANYREALKLRPNYVAGHYNLGLALAAQGQFNGALTQYAEAVRLKPDFAEAHFQMGIVRAKMGNVIMAIAEFRETLRMKPDWPSPATKLAWILATEADTGIRNPEEALRLAIRTCQLTENKDPDALDALAAAQAAAGRFEEAIATGQKAVSAAVAAGQEQFSAEIQKRLALYQKGSPFYQGKAR